MGQFITGSICLTDIDKTKIVNHKNGKQYLNIVIAENKDVDKFGNTHTMYISQSKEERDAKTKKCYIGNLKDKDMGSAPPLPSYNDNSPEPLPF